MKAILIDDEPLALMYLEYQLNALGGIEIIGKYTDPYKRKAGDRRSGYRYRVFRYTYTRVKRHGIG